MPADAVTLPPIEPPAFYGKMPGHGDFVGRGLTAQQEEAIDRWLASWMAAARTAWTDDFEVRYRSAQPWLYDGERLRAVAIPSADRVGRLFPLLAAIAGGAPVQALYDTVVTAIGEDWDGDRLLDALTALDAEPGAESPAGWFMADSDVEAMPHPMAAEGAKAVEGMLA